MATRNWFRLRRLGFDIGSTGSKAVALDIKSKEIIQEEYVATNGDPVFHHTDLAFGGLNNHPRIK